ncbi:MAG: VOC family protein, partial [Pseudomonadota bacterium]
MASPFTGIDHQVFVVADMEPAIEFWQCQLGVALQYRTLSEEHHVDQAFFPLPDGTFIELLAPTDTTSPVARVIENQGEGLYVLAMKVADLVSATEVLRASGAVVSGAGTDRVFVRPELPGAPMIQLWPEDRPHRWRDR